jgi:hypothetical protein
LFLRGDFTQTCSNSNKTQINTNWNTMWVASLKPSSFQNILP